MPPGFQKTIAFWRFPGFARLSIRYEQHVDEDEYRALVECSRLGKTEVLKKNLSKCRFVHEKSHMEWAAFEPRLTCNVFKIQFAPLSKHSSGL